MTTRSERYRFEPDNSKSRVVKNKELYEQIYSTDSYFQNDEKTPSIEQTNEVDLEKIKELLKGREIYRREMKMRELNMIKPSEDEVQPIEENIEEKKYDINAYLDKASSERVVEPYHKIDPEILVQPIEEKEEVEEPSLEELHEMGTTALSLDMFSDLTDSDDTEEVDEEDNIEEDASDDEELVATITKTEAFFTDSVKLNLDDSEEDEEEKSSPLIKIIMILLVLVVIALVVFLIFM